MEAEGGTKNGLRVEAGGGSQDGGDGCRPGGLRMGMRIVLGLKMRLRVGLMRVGL